MSTVTERTDTELLTAFATTRDEDAFAELVHRHAPLVWRVCRRVLGRTGDVEDAVQAAFLALAQQSTRGEVIRAVAPWLHRVGRDCAVNLLKSHQARERREQEAAMQHVNAEQPFDYADDNVALLHEELDALPDKYRQAIVLCHLQGMSLQEAATTMARPIATIATWAARGREQLKNRLAYRGVVLSLATITALLSAEAEAADIPSTFTTSTAKAASLFVDEHATTTSAEMLSSTSASLAKGALKKMSYAKIQFVTGLAALVLCVVGGSSWLVNQATGAEQGEHGKESTPLVTTPTPVVPPTPKQDVPEPGAQAEAAPFRVLEKFPVNPLDSGWQYGATHAAVIQNEEDLKKYYALIEGNPVYKDPNFWSGERPDKTFQKAMEKHKINLATEVMVFVRHATGPDTTVIVVPTVKDGLLHCTISNKFNGKPGPQMAIAVLSTVAIAVRRGEISKVIFKQDGYDKDTEVLIQK